MDWNTWNKLYKRLCATYGKTGNGEQSAAYYEALKDLPDERLTRAVTDVTKAQKYFPTPAMIREICGDLMAKEHREVDPLPWMNEPRISDEQTAEFLTMLRATKEKIFGRTMQ